MLYVSNRGQAPAVSLGEAIRNGAAPDGGLYLPQSLPTLRSEELSRDMPLTEFASLMLAPFFAGDALEPELGAICCKAFDFPVPLVSPDPARPGLRALELFHGPTGAFKDFGARFLMGCFDRLGDARGPVTVLAATSGDTGGAVGCAAEGRAGVKAVILFPKGRVSPFQELQLTCWDKPVRALEVDGDFDDCQRLVKSAFAHPVLAERHNLSSANSINIGRLLPQMAYQAAAASKLFRETGSRPGLIIPTGNLGHGVAAIYARAMGFPIGPIILATNANKTLSEWHRSGHYKPAPSIATIANAMDVGNPSNFERMIHLPPEQRTVDVALVDDEAIRVRIRSEFYRSNYVWCPHSAIAAEAYARLDEARRVERPWVVAATAHPFKFADVIRPIIGAPVAPPEMLARIIGRPVRKQPIKADLSALYATLEEKGRLAA